MSLLVRLLLLRRRQAWRGHRLAEAIDLSDKTVANALSLLKSQLGVSTTAELIRIAITGGYARHRRGPADD